MPEQATGSAEAAAPPSAACWLAAGVAVVVGIWLRFNGLTQPALADDEYYVVRSIENILRSGLPEYACGGYYPRGLLFQYLSAALVLAGAPIEFVPRYLAVLSSLIVLPGAWLIARRIDGTKLALVVLAWLSLSAWQIDGAQFGRMYAPFQAVFTWYAWFFLRAAVDDNRGARWGLAALTVVGILTWEGGVLLAATNLLLPFVGRHGSVAVRRDWIYLGAMTLLALVSLKFATTDFRHLDPAAVYPEGFESVETTLTPGWREVATMIGPVEQRQWLWIGAAILPMAASVLALLSLWPILRERWMTAIGMAVAISAAVVHQFAVTGLVIALLVCLGQLQWQDFGRRPARTCIIAMGLWLIAWLSYGLLAAGWNLGSDTTIVSRIPLLTLAYNLLSFPDFLLEIAKPWGGAVPRLSAALALAVAGALVLAGREPDRLRPDLRLGLFLLFLLLGGAAASDPPRHETRYVFFLYPLAIVVLLAMLDRLAGAFTRTPAHTAFVLPVAATLFVVTEDSGAREPPVPAWLQQVPTVLLPPTGKGHLIRQADSRNAGQWLQSRARPGVDLVINASPGVDFYYRSFDFAYIDWTQQRFLAYACDHGRHERWGNQPLLYTPGTLRAAVRTRTRTFIVAGTEQTQELLDGALRGLPSRIVHASPDARLQIIEIDGSSS
ncbi:MAG: glycosyltransferase family 39 protein [Steroidobacteraceae bacterium]